jgi:hypothetical protein
MRMKKSGSGFPWVNLLFLAGIIGLGIFAARFFPESMRLIDGVQKTPDNTITSTQTSPPVLPSIPLMPPSEAKPAKTNIATTPGIVVGEVISPTETLHPASPQQGTPPSQ